MIDHDSSARKTKACSPTWCRWSAGRNREVRPCAARAARQQQRHHAARHPHRAQPGDDEITFTAHVLMDGHTPAKLERLVAELSLQPGVRAVQWYAGDQAQTD